MNLAFYITLRREGKPIKDHPILKKLVSMKTQLARLKQIEVNNSLDSEIDKLLKNTGNIPLRFSCLT